MISEMRRAKSNRIRWRARARLMDFINAWVMELGNTTV